MAVVKTIFKIPSQDAQFQINGDYSATQIQQMYSAQFPGITSMTASVTEETSPEGAVRVITFAVRSGNKG